MLAFAMMLAAAVLVMASATARAQGHSGHTGQGQSANIPYDLQYIDMMLMHHQQGVEMAKLAQEKAQNAGVKAFAAKTQSDQEKDIAELKGHREHWYADRPQMDHSPMMQHMGSMPGHGR